MCDITDRKLWEARQRMLLRDQAHRLENMLAVVQSIARQTMRRHPAAQDFSARFEGRLEALASAHTLSRGAGPEAACALCSRGLPSISSGRGAGHVIRRTCHTLWPGAA
jgi:hypothetical protein